MSPSLIRLLPVLSLVAACGLPPKDLGDTGDESAGDDTGGTAPDVSTGPSTMTAGTDGASSGPDTNADTTADPGTTGAPLQCDDPLQFPGVDKTCSADTDCALVFHQLDCCGSLAGIGVNNESVDPYGEMEAMCAAQFPACECAPQPTTTEDGKATEDQQQIEVHCLEGLCQSHIPEQGPLQWYTTCGDPVCGGYVKPDGVPLCAGDQLEGNPCDSDGAVCDPVSDCNALLVCATEDPKQQEPGCPISRAKFKTDIEYLAPADLEKHAADLRSLKLATYRYREAPQGAPPRLGIILEDNEQGIWVDARHDRVDLYGYASLAVATLQVQQRQIATLQAEVERLAAELATARVCEP